MTETPALIKSYSAATRMLGPLTPLWVRKRVSDGKEDPERQNERHGDSALERPNGKLVWLHAASVGESQMLLPVIDRLLGHNPNLNILMTSGTMTSAQLLAERLPEQAIHQYIPLDYPKAVRNFLKHWSPDLAIWSESEIWPNLIRQTKKQNIPMVLLNARMNQKSIDNWNKRGPKSAASLFGSFDLILAANQETARGLSGILGHTVEMAGNLKDAAPALPVKEAHLTKLNTQIGSRPVWCAASTHPGEDSIMINAHKSVLERHPDALLILAPRHPERAPEIKDILKSNGLAFATRSTGRAVTDQKSVLLYDTIGEMGLAFRLSQVSFICGSLINSFKGHNPLEAARLDNAVLTGPHIASFADTYMHMFAFDAARRVMNLADIAPLISGILSDPALLTELRTNAKSYADSRDGVLDYVWSHLEPFVPLSADTAQDNEGATP